MDQLARVPAVELLDQLEEIGQVAEEHNKIMITTFYHSPSFDVDQTYVIYATTVDLILDLFDDTCH